MVHPKLGLVRGAGVWSAVALTMIAISSIAAAFVPPPCEDDPSRVIFAGAYDAPCRKFTADQEACELAYYLSDDDDDGGMAISCAFIEGTCVGCGGRNLACPENTCNGNQNGVATTTCIGDPQRTALLGAGGNGSERCRQLDSTDQATCENAFYRQDDDDDAVFGGAVACFWDSTTGACRGCGDEGSVCPFNVCDPTASPPNAVCTQDPERTNLLGYGGNDTSRCRRLDDTDQSTCENAFYEDEESGLPVACWWDGDECRGSGFDDFAAWNACLSTAAPPVATASCPREPDRMLLGFGNNSTAPCRTLGDTDQATCEQAFYEDAETGVGVACWWSGIECRGSLDHFRNQNACQITPAPPDAVCADDRTNLIGFGTNGDHPCRQLDDTDEATCENSFYENEVTGFATACHWTGNDCVGCGGRSECSANACVEPACAGDPTRTNVAGFGFTGQSLGTNGGACRQFDEEESCEESFYVSRVTGRGVACWWDVDTCRGSSRTFAAEDSCRVPGVCDGDPERTSLGVGGNNSQTCRQHDGDQMSCESSFYEEDRDGGLAIACWWVNDRCIGTANRNRVMNACQREPAVPAATCVGDPDRETALGFGHNKTRPCRSFDGTDAATCEDAFYQDVVTQAPVACWWESEDSECRAAGSTSSQRNLCDDRQPPCAFDMDRTYLGPHDEDGDPCDAFDGDEAACEDAYYAHTEDASVAVACFWDFGNCNAAIDDFWLRNSCFFEEPPAPVIDTTCGDRTNNVGFGNDESGPCRDFDETSQATCENSFYVVPESGKPVACWWDDEDEGCRGSHSFNAQENACDIEVACFFDSDRTNRLGFGQDSSAPCRQFDESEGGTQADCENAYYISDNLTPVACWWDDDDDFCRGSAGEFDENNACMNQPPPEASCEGRSDFLGFGRDGGDTCRIYDGSQSECEDAFYLDSELLLPTACTWTIEANQCQGTTSWPSLNVCRGGTPPSCGGRTLIGKGQKGGLGQTGGACRMFDDQSTCENAYYINRDDLPVSCSWDGDECRGTNRSPRSALNACAPEVGCNDRLTMAGFGRNGQQPCRSFDNTSEATCEDAYYVEPGGYPVACSWNAITSDCLACGRRGGKGTCSVNECNPVECAGDPERDRVNRCRQIGTQAECEDAWHLLGDEGLPPIAASCFWDADRFECFGCGPPSQGEDQCANACETGCGNGVIDGGETCDDGNMYDGDCCDSTCQLEADGSPCTDRLFCTVGSGTCDGGDCVGAPSRPCSSCLADDCNESTNSCGDREQGPLAVAAVLSGVAPPDPSTPGIPLPPGTECDDGIPGTDSACNEVGLCIGELIVPTMTPTSTPTGTITSTPTSTPTTTNTGTPTHTPTITPTPVPVGGPCAESAECVEGAACVENVCTLVAAPAPVASGRAMLAILASLLAVAALSLRRATRRS